MYEPASYGLRQQADLTSVTGPERTHTGALRLPEPVTPVLPTEVVEPTEGASWTNVFGLLSIDTSATPTVDTEEQSVVVESRPLAATDVVCPMYARVDECVQLSKLFPTMPVIQCEYAHMMGTSFSFVNALCRVMCFCDVPDSVADFYLRCAQHT